jgi:hypothetical protein
MEFCYDLHVSHVSPGDGLSEQEHIVSELKSPVYVTGKLLHF